jgi:hypothetical protein
MCRALYTLEHGTIVSKPRAIQWAQARHESWVKLMDRAVAASQQKHEGAFLDETLSFIRFVKNSAAVIAKQVK